MNPELSDSERDLLDWLSQEDTSQYGECYGKSLDRLIELGLAYLHGEDSEQFNTFLAKRRGSTPNIMYRAVSLTEDGYALAKEMRDQTPLA